MPRLNYAAVSVLALQGATVPSVGEFLDHPDFRQIATFFLGWVFVASLGSIVFSPTVKALTRQCGESILLLTTKPTRNTAGQFDLPEKSSLTFTPNAQNSSILSLRGDSYVLVLIMSICFAFASIAHFSSLLSFGASNGAVACAFLVAWGGISDQCARSIGVLILSFELKELGIKSWESFCIWGWLLVAMMLSFATYAIGVGKVQFVSQLDIYLCYRRYFLPTSLAGSLVHFLVEAYILARLLYFIAPRFLEFRHRAEAAQDTRVLRAVSLLLFELLTVVPYVKFIGVVGEFVPFSIGALVVIVTFNRRSSVITVDDVMSMPSLHLPCSLPPPVRSTMFSVQTHIPNHPFAAPTVPSTIQDEPASVWSPVTARSSISVDSTTANSIRAAVVQVASRSKRTKYPFQYLDPFTPPVPLLSEHSRSIPVSPVGARQSYLHLSIPPESRDGLREQTEATSFFSPEQSESPQPMKPSERPQITVEATSQPSSQVPSSRSSYRSRGSALYGSDIIRGSTDMVDLTKEPLSTHELSRMKSIASSPRESVMSSPWSIRRQSVTSTVVPVSTTEGHEASAEAFLSFGVPSSSKRLRLRTFGEQSFKSLGFVTPPGTPRRSIFGQPMKSHIEHNEGSKPVVSVEVVPDVKRTGLGRIRGPRPPPKAFSLVATMPKLPEIKPLKIRGKKSIDSQSSYSGPGDQSSA